MPYSEIDKPPWSFAVYQEKQTLNKWLKRILRTGNAGSGEGKPGGSDPFLFSLPKCLIPPRLSNTLAVLLCLLHGARSSHLPCTGSWLSSAWCVWKLVNSPEEKSSPAHGKEQGWKRAGNRVSISQLLSVEHFFFKCLLLVFYISSCWYFHWK